MKKIYYLIAMVACMLFTQNLYAQNKSDLLLNIKGTTQKITTANIDSITFEKSKENDRNLVLHIKDFTHKFSVSNIDSIAFEKTESGKRAPFTAIIDKISELYTTLHIIPDDPNMTYNFFCEPKEDIDKYPNDEAIAADDKIYFQELADGYGITLSECLSFFLVNDVFEDFNTELIPNTEYVMYVYGMTLEGEKTTPMLKVYFKTKTPEYIKNTINIEYTFENGTIDVNYIPDNNNIYYTCGLFHSDDVPYFSLIETQLQQSISNGATDYILGEAPLSEYLERSATKGKYNMKFDGADKSQTYYLVAAYLDDECGICSDVTVKTIGGEEAATNKFSSRRTIRTKKAIQRFR